MTLEKSNFTHQCLIAMPAMADPRFSATVTYIVKHDDEGAVGLVINRPLELSLRKLLTEVGSQPVMSSLQQPEQPVLYGGPVNTQMGFVLHQERGQWANTVEVEKGICVTSSRDILEAIAKGLGPEEYVVALGYAGWSAGQLEQEMSANAWLTCEADTNLLFKTPFEQRWQASLRKLGVDPIFLMHEAGHA